MTSLVLEGHYGRPVPIDSCEACQAVWFDRHESLQRSPASVLRLFRIMGDAGARARAFVSNLAACPRCRQPLVTTHDQQHQSTFEYRPCPEEHGRLITCVNVLREKDFIRPISATQLDELRKNPQSVNCSNCGPPIDLAWATVCAHCATPLSILDIGLVKATVGEFT